MGVLESLLLFPDLVLQLVSDVFAYLLERSRSAAALPAGDDLLLERSRGASLQDDLLPRTDRVYASERG